MLKRNILVPLLICEECSAQNPIGAKACARGKMRFHVKQRKWEQVCPRERRPDWTANAANAYCRTKSVEDKVNRDLNVILSNAPE